MRYVFFLELRTYDFHEILYCQSLITEKLGHYFLEETVAR